MAHLYQWVLIALLVSSVGAQNTTADSSAAASSAATTDPATDSSSSSTESLTDTSTTPSPSASPSSSSTSTSSQTSSTTSRPSSVSSAQTTSSDSLSEIISTTSSVPATTLVPTTPSAVVSTPAPTSSAAPPPPTSSTKETSSSKPTTAAPSTSTFKSTVVIVSSTEISISVSSLVPITSADGNTGLATVYTVVPTTVPATTFYSTTVVTSTSSPSAAAGVQDVGASSSGGGLSTGAKAGIGAGVGVLVIAAAIFGAWFGMRRRRRGPSSIADSDRYPSSAGPSMVGMGLAGKPYSDHTPSELPSPPLRTTSPRIIRPLGSPDRTDRGYVRPYSEATTQVPNSHASASSEDDPYRSPVVPAGSYFPHINELPETEQVQYLQPGGQPRDGSTPSQYSDDQPYQRPLHQQKPSVDNSLELPGHGTLPRTGYRGVDPEVPLHQRLPAPGPMQPGRWDPSQNF